MLVTLANSLDKSKFEVTIISLFGQGVNARELAQDIAYIPKRHLIFRGMSYLFKLVPPRLLYRKYIGRDDFELVIAYLQGISTKVVWGAGCRKIAWIHGDMGRPNCYAQRPFLGSRTMARCYSDYDAVVAVADTVKRSFCERTGLTENVHTCYNSNNTEKIRQLAREHAALPASVGPIICSVGRFTQEKGFDRLLRVCRKLTDKGLRFSLVLIGSGHLLERTKETASRLRLHDVHFVGYQINPYKFMSRSDLFVCSSYQEGMSTATTEAVILGLPVVSTLVSGAEEILGKDSEYGLVTENSENGLFGGLRKLLSEPDTFAHYKRKAAERAPFFDNVRTVKTVEALFERVSKAFALGK